MTISSAFRIRLLTGSHIGCVKHVIDEICSVLAIRIIAKDAARCCQGHRGLALHISAHPISVVLCSVFMDNGCVPFQDPHAAVSVRCILRNGRSERLGTIALILKPMRFPTRMYKEMPFPKPFHPPPYTLYTRGVRQGLGTRIGWPYISWPLVERECGVIQQVRDNMRP